MVCPLPDARCTWPQVNQGPPAPAGGTIMNDGTMSISIKIHRTVTRPSATTGGKQGATFKNTFPREGHRSIRHGRLYRTVCLRRRNLMLCHNDIFLWGCLWLWLVKFAWSAPKLNKRSWGRYWQRGKSTVKGATAAEMPRHGIGVIRGFVVLFCSFATEIVHLSCSVTWTKFVFRHVNGKSYSNWQCSIHLSLLSYGIIVPWYHACKSAETLHGGKVINKQL